MSGFSLEITIILILLSIFIILNIIKHFWVKGHWAKLIFTFISFGFLFTSITMYLNRHYFQVPTGEAAAVTCYWVGDTPTAVWSDPWHWSNAAGGTGNTCNTPATVPDSDDTARFSSDFTTNVTIDTNVNVAGFIIQAGYTGVITDAIPKTVSGQAQALNTSADLDFTTNGANVKISVSSGDFSGYAWSDDLGWVAFGTADNPDGPVNYNSGTGDVTGKAKVLNDSTLIDFNAAPYFSNVHIDGSGIFSGYAWSEAIGWINFTGVSSASVGTIAVGTSNFSQADGVFTGGGSSITFNGTWTLTGGTFTATTGTTTFSSSFTHNVATGTFSHNNGTVNFNASSTYTIDVNNTELFNNVEFNALDSDYYYDMSNDTLEIDGTLTLTNGYVRRGTINADSTVSVANTFDGSSSYVPATLLLDNSDVDQSFTIPNGAKMMGINLNNTNAAPTTINFAVGANVPIEGSFTLINGTFTASSGTTTFKNNFTHNVATGTFAHNSGTVNFNTSGVPTIDVNTTELFNNVEFNATADDIYYMIESGDSIEVDGTLTLTNGYVTRGTINADSTVSVANTFDGGDAILLLDNSAVNQSFTIPDGAQMMGINLNNTNAAPTTINFAVGANVPIESHFTLINGTFTASSGTTTFLRNFTHNVVTGTFNHNGGTVNFNASHFLSAIDVNNTELFNNVEFSSAGGEDHHYNTISTNDSIEVDGTLTLTNGFVLTGTINADSTVSVANTFDGGDAILLLDNSAVNQSFTIPDGAQMMGINLNNTNAAPTTINFAVGANVPIEGALTLINGTFTASTGTLTFLSNFTHNVATGTFDRNNGTVIFYINHYGSAIDVNTTETFNNVEFNTQENNHICTISSNDTVAVNGTLTLTNGRINTGTLDAKGHVTIADTFDGGTGILKFSGGNDQTFTDNGGVMMTGGPVVIDKTVGKAVNLATNMTFASAGQDLTITSGTLDLSSHNLVLTPAADILTVAANGTLRLEGGETITASTKTLNAGSTVYYDGAGASYNLKNYSYSNLTLNGGAATVFSSSANITGAATVTLTSGIMNAAGFDLTATTLSNDTTLRLQGNETNITFTNMDTDTGAVEYTGRNASETLTIKDLGGAGADYFNLSINDTNGTKATFQLGAALDVNGNLSILSGTLTSGTNFNINVGGNWTNAGTYTSGTNTTTFDTGSAATITTGGTGATQDFNNFTIDKSGGSLQVNANGLDVDGTLTLTNGTLNMNTQPLTANGQYSQTNGTFTGSTNSLTFGGAWTLTDGIFNATTGITTFRVEFTHNIATGTFTHNSGTVNFNAITSVRAIDVNNTELFHNVEFDASSDTRGYTISTNDSIEVDGTLTLTNGLVSSNLINADSTVSVADTFDGGSTTLLLDNSDVNQSFTIPSGANMIGINLNNANAAPTTINFEAGANCTIGGSFTLINGTFTASTGTLTFLSNFTHNVATGTFTHNSGTVNFNAGTTSYTIDVNTTETFNNVELDASLDTRGYTISTNDSIVINGTLTLTNGKVNTGTINAQNAVTIADTFDGGTGILKFSGGNDQTFTDNGGVMMTGGPVVIDKTVGKAVNLATNMTFASAGQDLTITSGTLDLSSHNLVLTAAGDVLTVGANGTLRLEGGETVTASTKTLNTGSTVYYDGTGASYNLKNYSYSNLIINGGAATVFSSTANITGAATITITTGYLNAAGFDLTATTLANDSTLRLQGNETNITFTNMDTDTGAVEYKGRNVSETLTIKDLGGAGADYYNLSINDTNGTKATFQLGAALDVNGNLSILSGTLTSGTNFNINVAGSWSNAGTYTSGTNTTTFDTSSTATITTGGTGTTQDFNNFTIDKSGGSLQVNTNGLDVDGTLTLTNGTLNMNTQPLTANGAYSQTNGTFTGSTNSLTFGGLGSNAWTLTDGIFNATTGITTFQGSFTHNVATGTFSHNNGTVNFNARNFRYINVNITETFNNVEFNAIADFYYYVINSSIEVDGTLTLTNGEVGGTVNADSTVSVANTFDGGNGTLLLDNSAVNQSFTIPDGATMMGINLNNTNAAPTTINFAAGANVPIEGPFTLINGTFTCSSGTTTFNNYFTHNVATGTFSHNSGTVNFNANATSYTIDVNTTKIFNNVEFIGSSTVSNYTISTGDTVAVNGTLTLTNGRVYGPGTLDAKNAVTIANTFDGGTGILKFSGGNDQTFTDNGGVMMTGGPVVIDKTVGKAVNLATNMTFASAGQDLTITSGTLDLSSHNLVLTAAGDVLTVDTNGTLRLEGGETITASTKTLNAGSTVYYDGAGASYTLKPYSYSNLTINGGAASVFSSPANLTGIATLTLTNSYMNAAGFDLIATTLSNDSTLRLQGNETNITFTNMDTDTGTVEYRGRNVSETLTIKNLGGAGDDYFNLTINDQNATKAQFELGANTTLGIGGTLSILSSTLSAAGHNLTATTLSNITTLYLQGNEATVTFTNMDTDSGEIEYIGRNIAETLTIKDLGGAGADYNNLTINDINVNQAVFALGADVNISGVLNISSSVFAAAGQSLTATTLVNNDILRLQGNEATITITNMDIDSGTTQYVGRNVAETLTIKDLGGAGTDYFNLTINDTHATKAAFDLGADLNIDGDLVVSLGTFSPGAFTVYAPKDINLTGGNLTPGASTFILDGAGAQNITSSAESFNDLTIVNNSAGGANFDDNLSVSGTFTAITANTRLYFTAGTTATVNNINLNGQDTGSRVLMRSSNPGAYWDFVVNGAQVVLNTSAQDSDASAGPPILANSATNNDDGHNLNWIFSSASSIQFTDSSGTAVSNFALTANIYATVTDNDEDLNPGVKETVQAIITSQAPASDSEALTLTETGVNTGVFRNITALTKSTYDGSQVNNDGTIEIDFTNNTVTASYTDDDDPTDTSTDTATAQVLGPVDSVTVSPTSVALDINGNKTFSAKSNDANGVERTAFDTFTWSVVSGGGTINSSSGMFTAGSESGTFSNTIRAAADGSYGYASVIVNALEGEEGSEGGGAAAGGGTGTGTHDNQPPDIKIKAPDEALVETLVNFEAAGSEDNVGITEYLWDFGDGKVSDKPKTNHIYREVNHFEVYLTLKDAAGNESILTHAISILPPTPKLTKIDADKTSVILQGKSYPNTEVVITLRSDIYQTKAHASENRNFASIFDFKDSGLAYGDHKIIIFAQRQVANGVILKSSSKSYDAYFSLNDSGELIAKIKQLQARQWFIIGGFGIFIIALIIIIIFLLRRRRKGGTETPTPTPAAQEKKPSIEGFDILTE